jgi:hypothetical protein
MKFKQVPMSSRAWERLQSMALAGTIAAAAEGEWRCFVTYTVLET